MDAGTRDELIAQVTNLKILELYRGQRDHQVARLLDRELTDLATQIIEALSQTEPDVTDGMVGWFDLGAAREPAPGSAADVPMAAPTVTSAPRPTRIDTAEDMANEERAGEIGPRIRLPNPPAAQPETPAEPEEPEPDREPVGTDRGLQLVHEFLRTIDALGITDAAAANSAGITADAIKRWRSEGLKRGPFAATCEKLQAFLDARSVKAAAPDEPDEDLRKRYDRWATKYGLSAKGAADVLQIQPDQARQLRRGINPGPAVLAKFNQVAPPVNGAGARP